ncbi:hypothetical protein STN0717ENT64_18710 [Enterobacter hormaechei]|uniref:ead/Ea22-like family protein n=1 Tax=Enterobacter hormaechei TaxID=158836 RepID=UPI0018A67103|nr:ead/Ea22-like family protein [Enterobacter hormaechei]BBW35470.1 hypothetical protein STN0717ENT64_18710 [Enterobacter hormaechei]
MSNINKRALREAAEKATPGRIGDRIDGSGSIKYQCLGNDGSLVLQTDHKNMEYGFIGGNSDADELFFRLCDPATVLALLDELEAAEERVTELSQKDDIYDMLRQDYELHGSLVDFVDWQAKRIAELEAREVELPAYRNSPDMHTKQYYEAVGFNQGLDACTEVLRATGISVKGE